MHNCIRLRIKFLIWIFCRDIYCAFRLFTPPLRFIFLPSTSTACPRSLDPFFIKPYYIKYYINYIVTYYINWAKTSWTDSRCGGGVLEKMEFITQKDAILSFFFPIYCFLSTIIFHFSPSSPSHSTITILFCIIYTPHILCNNKIFY